MKIEEKIEGNDHAKITIFEPVPGTAEKHVNALTDKTNEDQSLIMSKPLFYDEEG